MLRLVEVTVCFVPLSSSTVYRMVCDILVPSQPNVTNDTLQWQRDEHHATLAYTRSGDRPGWMNPCYVPSHETDDAICAAFAFSLRRKRSRAADDGNVGFGGRRSFLCCSRRLHRAD